MSGPDLDPQLSASMRRTIVQHARTHPARSLTPHRVAGILGSAAILAGVTATAVVLVVAGLPRSLPTPPIADTPTVTATPSPSPTPTPTETTPIASDAPTETPGPPQPEEPAPDLVAGYDARQLWDLCVARGQKEFPDSVATSDYELRFVHLTPDGIPEVSVSFDTPDALMPTGTIWICQFGGDPASPEIDFFNAKDI